MKYVQKLQILFTESANKDNALPMEKYMRNQFIFHGIKTPLRRKLMRQFFKETEIHKEAFQAEFVRSLWQLDEREYQYAAMDYIALSLEKLNQSDIELIEELITLKSWWDTVDMLAPKAVGTIASRFPEIIPMTIEQWANGENMWLQRGAILFQLKYKADTDAELLYRYIRSNATSKEFFIQKAIGWALREYSKTNSESVQKFIESNQLAKLSVREGSKYLHSK